MQSVRRPFHSSPPSLSRAANATSARTQQTRLILLAGGHVRQDFVTLLDITSPAMLPYMGRPLIYVSVLNFLKLGGREVLVVIPEAERRVEVFLRSAFGSRIALTIVRARHQAGATPLDSLKEALDSSTASGRFDHPVMIAHGDIYYDVDRLEAGDRPIVFTSSYIESDKYSTVHATEAGYQFQEAWAGTKAAAPEDCRSGERYTDIGLYYLPSAVDAYHALANSRPSATTVGGFLFHRYAADLKLDNVASWIDLGHLDTSARIRTHLLGTRECNHLDIDEMRGLITKRGRNRDKLLQEINYYHRLPKELTVYFPRLLESRLGKEVSYTIEYYGYKTLSEYLVFYEVPKTVWRQVLLKILAIHKAFTSRAGRGVERERAFQFYWGKTHERLEDREHLSAVRPLLDLEEVEINGVIYPGWKAAGPHIQALLRLVADRCTTSVIHGDLCCSNILYDPRTSLIKFIDPRGEFFEEGCYGDPRYDLAKLLHSFHGGYDFILHEMYQLSRLGEGRYELSLLRSDGAREAECLLFELLQDIGGCELADALAIEAHLFLTMLPFHCDDPKRQAALYLRGLMLLQQACEWSKGRPLAYAGATTDGDTR
jgi:phosphotransferase family enzyme